MNDLPAQTSPASPLPRGCALALVFILLGGWNVLASAIMIGWNGVLEQDLMMRVLPGPDPRGLLALGFGLAIWFPAAMVAWLVREPAVRRAARVFSLGGLLVLFLAPPRLAGVQQSQLGAVLQLVGIAAFSIVIWLVERSAGRRLSRPSWVGLGWALAIGAGLGVPWALWGALGSPLDTFLALLVALCTAVCFTFAWNVGQPGGDVPPVYTRFFLDGLLGALVLLPICAGLGANGSAAMLALAVPWLAWPAAGLVYRDGLTLRSSWPAAALLIAMGLFWPLACVDLEELSILLSDLGEASRWLWTAGGLSAVLSASSAFLAAPLLRLWLANRILRTAGWVLGGLTWMILLVVYFFFGQPGFYGERLFVILKDQADLSFAAAISDPQERRAEVYARLVTHADRAQASLRADLEARGIGFTSYYLVNAIEVQGDPLLAGWLEARPEVDRVLIDTRLRPLPQPLIPSGGGGEEPGHEPGWNLSLIGADRVWRELGITGAGILVGQSDSGVDGSHPELMDSYRKLGSTDAYSWYDPWNRSTAPVDVGGHGTHTLGSVLGNRVGVAPDAEWIACVNLGRNLGNPALYLDCMQFNFAPFPQDGDSLRDGKPEFGAQILNNSWGCPPIEGCDPGALQAGVAALRAAGVFVVVSAGNDGDGGCGTVAAPPALYDEVFSVGAVDSNGNLASFSSLGPVSVDGSQRLKPDVVAPGVNVLSAFPGGAYASSSGTSMAGPHTAGVVALMWSANPDLVGDIERTEEILRDTARPYSGSYPDCVSDGQPNNAAGYGMIDAYAAVQAALAIQK